MTVKLQATQRSEFSDENMLVYDYRPSFNYYQDFQVIIIGEFSNDGILHCLRMTVPRNATLQQEGIRLSHFKTFDNLEEYLSSAYEEPWLSYNNILKKDTKTDNELYEAWLSAGERLIENGRFISRWYNTLILNDGQEIDVMALKMTPDIELEIYPILMKEYIEYRSEKE
jgi:hypothetical protein